MKRSVRFKLLWTLWMVGGGLATATVVYAITTSFGWAIVGLLVSGVALNAIGQAAVRPTDAARGTRRSR